ncbi:dUTP diphosphatase [Metabacillus malikii]|uniref:Dimeric dUTPase (All-alpha-NTP-PPase superfamily) n=1 Tax=Metabacillus malikii TaxID=1504265 RepID=A0ABT9ZIE5_9BACI|nr:dUTP diphosphatase [Metabacillus malikii]MDQ0230990.1 dimeric dUTPase (all-alpha-NTP-PPase superfamily) [Metabacillus malikii]
MNLDKLFSMQKELDEKIEAKHGLHNEPLIEKKLLALLVEVGELANETRCFKFWSVKPPAPVQVILEEYVDGIHFILSIGLELKLDKTDLHFEGGEDRTVTEQFLTIYESIATLKQKLTSENYVTLFNHYIHLGKLLGFSNEQIEQAYVAKNDVNHERQMQGY